MADYVPYSLSPVAGLGTDFARYGDNIVAPPNNKLSEWVSAREIHSGLGGNVHIEPDGDCQNSISKIEILESDVARWHDRGRSTSLIAGELNHNF